MKFRYVIHNATDLPLNERRHAERVAASAEQLLTEDGKPYRALINGQDTENSAQEELPIHASINQSGDDGPASRHVDSRICPDFRLSVPGTGSKPRTMAVADALHRAWWLEWSGGDHDVSPVADV